MTQRMNLNSPIEQFNVHKISLFFLNNNFSLYFIIIFAILLLLILNSCFYNLNLKNNVFFMYFLSLNDNTIKNTMFELSFIPNLFQYLFEYIFINFIIFYKSLINWEHRIYYFTLFFNSIIFILLSNLIGLIPYSFAITAQIFVTINLSLYLFLSFNIIGIMKHKLDIFDIFVPSGVNMFLEIILIPIEIISYIFRPISLSIRLFANIMAGHTLLKVICNFIVKFFKLDIFLVFNFFPFLLLVILFGLELFVALIQSYVFFILICLFLKDIINLDH
jgi:F-type H+-transporting ATPase subunit a